MIPHFGDDIETGDVSMKLWFVVNWIGNFLKQLHTDVAEQPCAIVDNPAAPWRGTRTKTFFHPRHASAHKSRFAFVCRSSFSAESITQLSQRTTIARPCEANPDPNHRPIVLDSTIDRYSLHVTTRSDNNPSVGESPVSAELTPVQNALNAQRTAQRTLLALPHRVFLSLHRRFVRITK